MKQNPMTVITEILPDQLQKLEAYLAPIGTDIKNNPVIKFSNYQQLHYCTFFVIPGKHPSEVDTGEPDLLAFEANVDGDVKQFINDLLAGNPDFVNTVYSCCKDYPGDNVSQLADYLLKNDFGANAFYVAHPGQTRNTIYEQQQIRQRIQDYIDANRQELAAKQPAEIHSAIVQHLEGIKKPEQQSFFSASGKQFVDITLEVLTLILSSVNSILGGLAKIIFKYFKPAEIIDGPTVFNLSLSMVGMILVGGYFGMFGPLVEFLPLMVLIISIAFAVNLRWHEMRDKQDDKPWVVSKQMEAIQRVEDRQLQNHLTSVIDIKPGWFRLTTLRVVLAGINLVAKLVATKGDLSGIVTIHFARWVILPGNKRLLFMSNYDGSWENYLGEFIDHASVGLSAVWSNTQLGKDRGFPDTQWLALRGGSRDEQRFKNFARNSQLAELVWYSAYIDLSVKNVANNRAIHEGLFSTTNLAAWLRCL